MNSTQKQSLQKQNKEKRGAAIVDSKMRLDGYSNMLTKYGLQMDSSISYDYSAEPFIDDMSLINLYEGNGLFKIIIDRPSEEAVKHGLDIDYGDDAINEYVSTRLDDIDFEDAFCTAEKWARLYGGAIVVMLVDDGGSLEEPLNIKKAKEISELHVFERSIVQPDWNSMYNTDINSSLKRGVPFGEPEFFVVSSYHGIFKVHRSRCLVFRNGRLPEQATDANYRYWGVPEYVLIRTALQQCSTSHEDGVKLLDRCVQAIYKMKNLSNLMATDQGEDKVIQRLQTIDMARSILSSLAIDAEGEDYAFQSMPLTGVNDIINTTCNLLSAVSRIPQAILFGRSPSGENATGESDFENYYNMVENIQKQNMKKNVRTIIDLILRQGKEDGDIKDIPKYKVQFAKLWSLSDEEEANIEKIKADTVKTKADTACAYLEAGVIEVGEVRKGLAEDEDFFIDNIDPNKEVELSEVVKKSLEGAKEAGPDGGPTPPNNGGSSEDEEAQPEEEKPEEDVKEENEEEESEQKDSDAEVSEVPEEEDRYKKKGRDTVHHCASVLVVKDGRFLVGDRDDGKGLCGPGGHAQWGETPEEAAIREAQEEFGITPKDMIPLNVPEWNTGSPVMYFTTEFDGEPKADEKEMHNARFLSLKDLNGQVMLPGFKKSIDLLFELLNRRKSEDKKKKVNKTLDERDLKEYTIQRKETEEDGGPGSGPPLGNQNARKYANGSEPQSTDREKKVAELEKKLREVKQLKEKRNLHNKSVSQKALAAKAKQQAQQAAERNKPEEKSEKPKSQLQPKERSTPMSGLKDRDSISATGSNKFNSGFSKWNGTKHYNEHKHEFGKITEEEYRRRALDLIQSKCDNDVLGYKRANGQVIRFRKSTGEYVCGHPDQGIATFMKPKYNDGEKGQRKRALKYFLDQMKEDLAKGGKK